MTKYLPSLLAIAAVALLPGRAHADGETSRYTFVTAELTPLALGTVSLVANPTSRAYATVEVAVGGVVGISNAWSVIEALRGTGCGDECGGAAPYAVLGLLDAAVVTHGIYMLLRDDEPDAMEIKVGTARGHVAPAVVTDGKSSGAGLGVIGSF